ncbi:MAG: hypothetical protein F2683_09590, partial [Actinobacteria bacterium]|nr:hypothetical protein [Actinomycetota bacterium]
MKIAHVRLGAITTLALLSLIACSSSNKTADSATVVDATTIATTDVSTNLAETSTTVATEPTFAATLGTPITGYADPVDIAVRQGITLQSFTSQSYIVERAGKIYELASDGRKGTEVLDISDLTIAQGEQGLLGLAFAPDGSGAYVNYTNLAGDTVIA